MVLSDSKTTYVRYVKEKKYMASSATFLKMFRKCSGNYVSDVLYISFVCFFFL